MWSNWLTSATSPSLLPLPHSSSSFIRKQNPHPPNSISFKKTSKTTCTFICLAVSIEQFAEIAHNKVLVAAVASSAIGGLSKPFSSALFYGKKMDFSLLVKAGGFPSVHSAGVAAAATSLALERGFSDSIFGMTAIFAAIVMYDAQAVRREVGNHAKVLNKKLLFKTKEKSIPFVKTDDGIDSKPGGISSEHSESRVRLMSISDQESTYEPSAVNSPPLYPSEIVVDGEPVLNMNGNSLVPLEESIGHTEVEVIAGALLGFIVTLVVYSIM